MASLSEERERRQIKVFTKWCNSHLRKKGVEIEDLGEAFKTGVNLCYLYEIIADEKLPKYNENPKMLLLQTNNLSIVLTRINSFVEECGIRLQYSPQQIAAGDARSTLGMLWILITKFVIPESEESLSRKRSLLRWVQRVTEPYDNVDVKNFTRSWKDGLAFNALLHQFDNDLMDYDALTPDDPAHNCENAFAIAEQLGIYRLLDVDDITELEVPDEKSVMTYVSTMYQYFHSQAGRKLEQECKKLILDIGKMLDWIRQATEDHDVEEFPHSLSQCKDMEEKLAEFQKEKELYSNFKCTLYLKLAGIQRVQRNERLKVFSPPEDQNIGTLQDDWVKLNTTLINYSSGLRAKLDELEMEALKEYDQMAASFLSWITSNQHKLTSVEEVADDEEDESTDEETREKRKKAVVEVKEKQEGVVEHYNDLVANKIAQFVSVPKSEVVYATDTFIFALVGEESESLTEIRNFQLPEGTGGEEEEQGEEQEQEEEADEYAEDE